MISRNRTRHLLSPSSSKNEYDQGPCNREGGVGGPWPSTVLPNKETFVAQKQNCLKRRLGRHFLES